jgi:alkylated DNA repair dioxygenase AlkB
MPQLDLFGSGSRVLVDDTSGRITYHAAALDARDGQLLFDHLIENIAWRHSRRQMYDREVDVPRLEWSSRIDESLPPALTKVVPIVESLSAARFSSIGMNLYRDGRDSVAPHNDSVPELTVGSPVAILSLGSARRMTIRSKAAPRRILDIDLESGSVLVMSYETQHSYDHGIPKTSDAVGQRISVVFRCHP